MFDMARQEELLQTRAMLSSVTFDYGSKELSVNLDGSDSATAAINSGQDEVSINGVVTRDTPAEFDVYMITVTGGDGGHVIDLSSLTNSFNNLLMSTSIITGSGEDHIAGSALTDIINSGAGNDVVHGECGVDTIDCGPDNDTLHGDGDYGGTTLAIDVNGDVTDEYTIAGAIARATFKSKEPIVGLTGTTDTVCTSGPDDAETAYSFGIPGGDPNPNGIELTRTGAQMLLVELLPGFL